MVDMAYEDSLRAGPYDFWGLSTPSTEERRYHLDDSRLVSPYGHTLPPTLADLLDVAAGVMWADRNFNRPKMQARRGTYRQNRGWARHIHLPLGVRNPDLWNTASIKATLEHLLAWLTEDRWELSFEQQKFVRRHSDITSSLFESPVTDALILLYSGGLDSLAGTVRLLQAYPSQSVILVSATYPRLQQIVSTHATMLQSVFGTERVKHAPIPFHLIQEKPKRGEKTQRTRGFLFLTFGVAEAVACNASRVLACENGVGMLNLPLNRAQLGTQHTRSMNPQTFVEMNHLLSLLGFDIRCEAPHLFRTKGELCADLRDAGLGRLCAFTISCDSFPLRRSRRSSSTELHCGKCTSCLLRRQAIFASHLQQDDAQVPYEYDVCQPPQSTHLQQLEHLKLMLDQAHIFHKATTSSKPEYALLQEFPELITTRQSIEEAPELFGHTNERGAISAISDLLNRYAREWDLFPYQLRPM
jgi:7-cyano-7-deazaguanine synthase in queuosine biosynthesis